MEPRADNSRFLIVTLFLLVAGLAGIVVYLKTMRLDGADFISMAVILLAGFAAFLGIMHLLSRGAKVLGMIDNRQPFGLPKGSVRAILTMQFIVLVAVLTAFLVTNYDDRTAFVKRPIEIQRLTDVQAAESLADTLREQFGAEALVAIRQDGNQQVVEFLPRVDSRMADDVAKQTLTIITTILAAMIGFYFAERGNEAGAQAAFSRVNLLHEIEELLPRLESRLAEARSRRDAAQQRGEPTDTLDAHIAQLTSLLEEGRNALAGRDAMSASELEEVSARLRQHM